MEYSVENTRKHFIGLSEEEAVILNGILHKLNNIGDGCVTLSEEEQTLALSMWRTLEI